MKLTTHARSEVDRALSLLRIRRTIQHPEESPFFRLPPEIRNLIYRLLLKDPRKSRPPPADWQSPSNYSAPPRSRAGYMTTYLFIHHEPELAPLQASRGRQKPSDYSTPAGELQTGYFFTQNRAEHSPLLVNRQFHDEYAAVLYGETQFRFTESHFRNPVDYAQWFIDQIGRRNASMIRHILVSVDWTEVGDALYFFKSLERRAEPLKSLEVTIEDEPRNTKDFCKHRRLFTSLKDFGNAESLTVFTWDEGTDEQLERVFKGWVRNGYDISTSIQDVLANLEDADLARYGPYGERIKSRHLPRYKPRRLCSWNRPSQAKRVEHNYRSN
jgi:hypothetical protein